MTIQIPTAREAMSYAVQSARSGDAELAAVWVSIARELREGAVPGSVIMPGKAASREELAETRQRFRDASDRTESWNVERVIREPGSSGGSAAITAVMPASINLGELCAHCGYQIQLEGDMIVHSRTGQNVCPVPTTANGAHTFATPAVAERETRS